MVRDIRTEIHDWRTRSKNERQGYRTSGFCPESISKKNSFVLKDRLSYTAPARAPCRMVFGLALEPRE
jgi:hypothetical protein